MSDETNPKQEEQQLRSWYDLTEEEKSEFMKRMACEVRVKFTNGEIIGFNPFRQLCSFPAQYNITYYTSGRQKKEYKFVHDVIHNIENNGVETNNILYLEEAKIKASNMILNEKL